MAEVYLNPKWSMDDIMDVMVHHIGINKESISEQHKEDNYFIMYYRYNGEKSYFNLHLSTRGPLGPVHRLSEGEDAVLRGIVDVLGGAYSDDYNTFMLCNGICHEDDGMMYHVKDALLKAQMKPGKTDFEAIQELNASIEAWDRQFGK